MHLRYHGLEELITMQSGTSVQGLCCLRAGFDSIVLPFMEITNVSTPENLDVGNYSLPCDHVTSCGFGSCPARLVLLCQAPAGFGGRFARSGP